MSRQLLERAVAHHRRGELQAADELYREVLRIDPHQPDALHLLGLLAQHRGDLQGAIELIGRAIARDSRAPEFHRSLAGALLIIGNREGAKQAMRTALTLRPSDAEVAFQLGALLLDDDDPVTASVYLQRAAELRPDASEPRIYLGSTLRRLDRWAEAEQHLRVALALAPDNGTAHLVLGDVLTDLERYPEAELAYREAVARLPGSAEAHSNLGRLLERMGKLDEAAAAHRTALALGPDLAGAHWNYGVTLLRQGKLAEGWREMAWRWRAPGFVARRYAFAQPAWGGEPLAGKHILVWGEQGVGDEIMFASCIPDLLATGARVTVACLPRLVSLFARSFPAAHVIGSNQLDPCPPPTDFHLPIGDLPRFFRPTLDSFPRHAGYLAPPPDLVAAWQQRVGALGAGLKVGISWRSQLMTAARERSYTTLDEWAPIFEVPGVTFVNLQYDDCALALATAHDRFGVEVHTWPDLDLTNDFDGAAALMSALDLVITSPNSVGEFAGALGRPTWRIHRRRGTWTMLGTERRPWFPTMQVFEPGDDGIGPLMRKIAQELAAYRAPSGKNGASANA